MPGSKLIHRRPYLFSTASVLPLFLLYLLLTAIYCLQLTLCVKERERESSLSFITFGYFLFKPGQNFHNFRTHFGNIIICLSKVWIVNTDDNGHRNCNRGIKTITILTESSYMRRERPHLRSTVRHHPVEMLSIQSHVKCCLSFFFSSFFGMRTFFSLCLPSVRCQR